MARDPFDLTDEELEAAFLAAKEESGEEEGVVDDTIQDEVEEDEEVGELEDELEADEEIEEDMEHPDEQDSDDDASSDDEDEDEDEDDSEAEEDNLDGDSEDEEEQTDEDEDESKKEEQPVTQETERLKVKANGKEYDFTIDEMKSQFGKVFGQAMDYTKKMQAMKPDRKKLDIIQQTEMTEEDLNLFASVLKGDKGAINEVIRRTGVDTLELDAEENKYTPKDYGRDDTTLAIKDVIDEISSDREYDTTQKILSSEWDEKSWAEMSKDPQLIRLLHTDVQSGMYGKVQPIADKLKIYGKGSKSDLDYYKEAAGIYFQEESQEQARVEAAGKAKAEAEVRAAEQARLSEVKAKQAKQKTVKREATKRKAAAPTKRAAGTKKSTNYLDDSDEAFEDWYNNLQDM